METTLSTKEILDFNDWINTNYIYSINDRNYYSRKEEDLKSYTTKELLEHYLTFIR